MSNSCATHLARVVCVGGDGMFSEILHGLVTRTQTDNGVDLNQPDADLVPCSLHIGIIPAGEFETFHRKITSRNLLSYLCFSCSFSLNYTEYVLVNK